MRHRFHYANTYTNPSIDLPTAFESSRIGKILVPYIKEFYEAMKQGDSGAMDERRRKIHAKAMQAIRLIGSSSWFT